MHDDATYISYLLRLRRIKSREHPVWVPSVQSTTTGDQRQFADLEALIDFLRAEFGCSVPEAPLSKN